MPRCIPDPNEPTFFKCPRPQNNQAEKITMEFIPTNTNATLNYMFLHDEGEEEEVSLPMEGNTLEITLDTEQFVEILFNRNGNNASYQVIIKDSEGEGFFDSRFFLPDTPKPRRVTFGFHF